MKEFASGLGKDSLDENEEGELDFDELEKPKKETYNTNEIVETEKVADQASGKLQNNLTIKKAIVDTKGKEYPEPETLEEK